MHNITLAGISHPMSHISFIKGMRLKLMLLLEDVDLKTKLSVSPGVKGRNNGVKKEIPINIIYF